MEKVVLVRKGKSYLNKIGLGYRNINRNETYKREWKELVMYLVRYN